MAMVAMLVAALLGLPAQADDVEAQHRSFTARITAPPDGVVAASSSAALVLTLTNTSTGPHQLGSADITLPAGFTLISGTLQQRNLSLPPGGSVEVPLTVGVPCATGPRAFGVQAKQANNFRGPPGNDLQLIGAAPTVTVTGSCGTLTFLTQPKDAQVNEIITGSVGDPSATKVQVKLTANGVGVDGVQISVALQPTTMGALVGTTTATTASGGIATFTLKVDAVGLGYTLVASASGITPVTSDAFSIWEDITRCAQGSSCEVKAKRARSLDVTISGQTPSGPAGDQFLFLSLLEEAALSCNPGNDPAYPWSHAPHTVLFDLTGTFEDMKVATLRIDKSEVQKVTNNGASFYQVCFLGEEEFVPRGGGAPTFGPALLPDCTGEPLPNRPCVAARTKTQKGDMLVTIHLPPADPMFR